MIDKQLFNDTFQHFDKATIVMIIDLYLEQYPLIITTLEKNIAEDDLAQIQFYAHKIKGSLRQFYEPVSSEHARLLEETAKERILEIIDVLIPEYDASLKAFWQEYDNNEVVQKVYSAKNLTGFLSGFSSSFSPEKQQKIKLLEKSKVADGMPKMFADLKASSAELLEELLAMKKDLIC